MGTDSSGVHVWTAWISMLRYFFNFSCRARRAIARRERKATARNRATRRAALQGTRTRSGRYKSAVTCRSEFIPPWRNTKRWERMLRGENVFVALVEIWKLCVDLWTCSVCVYDACTLEQVQHFHISSEISTPVVLFSKISGRWLTLCGRPSQKSIASDR